MLIAHAEGGGSRDRYGVQLYNGEIKKSALICMVKCRIKALLIYG